MTSQIDANKSLLSEEEYTLLSSLAQEYNQGHLFEAWVEGKEDEKKKGLAAQLVKLNGQYPGGLAAYVTNSIQLLKESKEGKNPFAGFKPIVPLGERLTANTEDFDKFENLGMEEMRGACFVLVAGGLGERLGYKGIKVALPTELTTERCYLQHYCENILAFQERVNKGQDEPVKLPLAIMTSGDTHAKTVELLEANDYFGMKDQLTLMKQELVPAVNDNEGRFVLDSESGEILTKPHGHGDVHILLHSTKVVHQWAKEGRKWVCFFQDTNAMVMRAFPAAIGVSATHDFEVNSLTVARKPGEAVGGICKLVNEEEKKELTLNVEYNQLDPLLRATVSPEGDVADESGFSPYPGNINVLVFKLDSFAAVLDKTNGSVPEFVNPKYADKTKTTFKKPTRLECMMQDYPRLLSPTSKVGFTQFERFISFSAVKNNPTDALTKLEQSGFAECASSGEADMYSLNRKLLAFAGVHVQTEDLPLKEYLSLPVPEGARVVLGPQFGTTIQEIKSRFPSPNQVEISNRSSLVVTVDAEIHSLQLDGDLHITGVPGSKVVIKSLTVKNDGSELVAIGDSDKVEQKYTIRGYTRKEKEILVIHASKPGEIVIEK